MLNTQDIAGMISKPSIIGSEQVVELEKLTSKHPYAQVFSILLLKGLANTKDVSFDDQLTKHSFRISNRVQLYNLINQFENEQVISESKTIEPLVETKPIDQEETETITTIAEIKDSEIAPVEKEVTEEFEQQTPDIEPDPLEQSILHSALVSNFKLDELSPEEAEQLEVREKATPIENEQLKNEVEDQTNSAFTFVSWLHADTNYVEDTGIDKKAINSVVNDFEGFDPLSELSGEVEKPKAAFFSPTQKGKESLSEESLPVSETLAKIYILQGNYPKAIDAYNQLSLKFPEKKIFFANLIEDLKKKLNT